MTEEKELEEVLKDQLELMKKDAEEFISGISFILKELNIKGVNLRKTIHTIRNLRMVLQGNLEMIKEDLT